MNKFIIRNLILVVVFLCSSKLISQVNFTGPELIGRISNNSATVNIVADCDLIYYLEYGENSGNYSNRLPESGSFNSIADEPFEKIFVDLMANTKYYYRLVYSSDNGESWETREEYSFHTNRDLDSEFVFTIISDSHQSSNSSVQSNNLYRRTLLNAKNDEPDLHFDLGDAFAMTNIEVGDLNSAWNEYLFQRENMGILSHSTPIYLTIGNHEEEEGWNLDDAGLNVVESKPVMSTNSRKRYFLNPIPDNFFTGNDNNNQQEISGDHLREDYFSFQWGDALFISIDPYWNTMMKPYAGTAGGEANDEEIGDRWDWTLGEEQYLWFKNTLESSNAKWKFVFSHQVVGGISDYGRGGAEATTDYEWGAIPSLFEQWRPEWQNNKSIHQLMVENEVSIFFHGHDHVFAKEEIDNMIYQECPQPSDVNYSGGFDTYQESETTVIYNNSGHLRVTVSSSEITVDYIRAYLPGAGLNGEVAYSYTIEENFNSNDIEVNSPYKFQIYPNPFNPKINISFSLEKETKTDIEIYNLKGQKIKTLKSEVLNKGIHVVQWNGKDQRNSSVASGIYLIKLSTDYNERIFKKCVLLK